MTEQLQVSAKTIGQLVMPGFCERCYWIRLHCRKLPFGFMPGIFSSIDSFSKKATAAYYARHGRLPPWFTSLGLGEAVLVTVPHWSRFNYVDKETGILVTGMPDEILRKSNSKLGITDYKTARHTDRADALLPLYAVQLNVYACIAKQTRMGNADTLALMYYEPVTTVDVADVETVIDRIAMPFVPKVVPVPINTRQIPGLLRRTRMIFDKVTCPDPVEGCADCQSLAHLLNTIGRAA
jgi:hypothetical protein